MLGDYQACESCEADQYEVASAKTRGLEWVDMVDDQLCNQYDPPHIGLLRHGHTNSIIASDPAEFSMKMIGFL